jgi:predicted nucleic acid-binding protein
MLLDTTFFIDYATELQTRAAGPCAEFLAAHRHETKYVSVVTLGEFAAGATATETRRFFRGFQRLALGSDLAIFAGRLQASLPVVLGENDLWIVATARYSRLPLVTRNKALARVPGVAVLTY